MPEGKNTEKRKRVFTILFVVLAALTAALVAGSICYMLWEMRNIGQGIGVAPGVDIGVGIFVLLVNVAPSLLAAEYLLWRSVVYFFCADTHPWYRTVLHSFYALSAVNTICICAGAYGNRALLYCPLLACAALTLIEGYVTYNPIFCWGIRRHDQYDFLFKRM